MKEKDVILEKNKTKNFFIPNILNDNKDFDGPLDLLLFLIQENEANIYDLPISLITDQFILYINKNEANLNDLASFYKMGAELLYIKTKMLLPQISELDEEYEDPREELVNSLIQYQKFKKLTDLLSGTDKEGRLYFNRGENTFVVPFEDKELFQGVSLDDLLFTFSNILGKKPPTKIFNIFREVSISDKEALIMEELELKETVTIQEIIKDFENPLHTICAFMAILDMAKRNIIVFLQKVSNGEIYIFKKKDDWDGKNPDQNDNVAENYFLEETEEKEYSIINKNIEINLDEIENLAIKNKDNKDENIYIGDEEEINLDD